MSKKTFVIFGLLVLFFAVLIPWLAFRSDGDASRGAQKVPAHLKEGQTLFQINCGNCHALYAAGSDGNFAPDLDDLLASPPPQDETAIKGIEERVLNAIDNGVDSTTTAGRMPPGILSGEQAEEVAEFVANTAGEG
jgi:mono/diheme cytochrome c family protein